MSLDPSLIARLLWRRGRARRRERWTPPRLEAYQAAAATQLRRFALQRSPFYREFHRGCENAPLSELPVLSKTMLIAEFDRIVTDRAVRLADVRRHLSALSGDDLFLDRYRVTTTAGTTGEPGVFLHDRREWAEMLVSYNRAQEWAGVRASLTRRTRLAVVSSRAPWHASARVGLSLPQGLVPTLRIDATDPLADTVKRLNDFRPEIVAAYSSMGRILAEEQIAGRLAITPRALISASEVLTREMRNRMKLAFGVEPFDFYGATETGGIATECERHRMHLYEDFVIPEIVDENDRATPPGTFGAALLVTVLFSRTLPLIRYRMNDSVALASETCPCGRPFALIAGVEGRQEDVLRLPAASGPGKVAVHPNVFHRILDQIPSHGWQIRQREDALDVLIAAPGERLAESGLEQSLAAMLRQQGAAPPPIRAKVVEAVPRTRAGKAPLIVALKEAGGADG